MKHQKMPNPLQEKWSQRPKSGYKVNEGRGHYQRPPSKKFKLITRLALTNAVCMYM